MKKLARWVVVVLLGAMICGWTGSRINSQQQEIEHYKSKVVANNQEIDRLKFRVNKVESERRFVCTNMAKAIIPLDNR